MKGLPTKIMELGLKVGTVVSQIGLQGQRAHAVVMCVTYGKVYYYDPNTGLELHDSNDIKNDSKTVEKDINNKWTGYDFQYAHVYKSL